MELGQEYLERYCIRQPPPHYVRGGRGNAKLIGWNQEMHSGRGRSHLNTPQEELLRIEQQLARELREGLLEENLFRQKPEPEPPPSRIVYEGFEWSYIQRHVLVPIGWIASIGGFILYLMR